eukprot:scaffold34695_cov266-Amphora_coffeaeformis.AAC.9
MNGRGATFVQRGGMYQNWNGGQLWIGGTAVFVNTGVAGKVILIVVVVVVVIVCGLHGGGCGGGVFGDGLFHCIDDGLFHRRHGEAERCGTFGCCLWFVQRTCGLQTPFVAESCEMMV